MIFQDKEITANIFINSDKEIDKNILDKYFLNEDIETGRHEEDEINIDDEYDYYALICKSKISDEKIQEFIKELAKNNNYTIHVDSNDEYIYNNYSYKLNNDFITYQYVPEEFCGKSGVENLIGSIYHIKEEKIELV
jgi:HD superfamily phosphohydrolase